MLATKSLVAFVAAAFAVAGVSAQAEPRAYGVPNAGYGYGGYGNADPFAGWWKRDDVSEERRAYGVPAGYGAGYGYGGNPFAGWWKRDEEPRAYGVPAAAYGAAKGYGANPNSWWRRDGVPEEVAKRAEDVDMEARAYGVPAGYGGGYGSYSGWWRKSEIPEDLAKRAEQVELDSRQFNWGLHFNPPGHGDSYWKREEEARAYGAPAGYGYGGAYGANPNSWWRRDGVPEEVAKRAEDVDVAARAYGVPAGYGGGYGSYSGWWRRSEVPEDLAKRAEQVELDSRQFNWGLHFNAPGHGDSYWKRDEEARAYGAPAGYGYGGAYGANPNSWWRRDGVPEEVAKRAEEVDVAARAYGVPAGYGGGYGSYSGWWRRSEVPEDLAKRAEQVDLDARQFNWGLHFNPPGKGDSYWKRAEQDDLEARQFNWGLHFNPPGHGDSYWKRAYGVPAAGYGTGYGYGGNPYAGWWKRDEEARAYGVKTGQSPAAYAYGYGNNGNGGW